MKIDNPFDKKLAAQNNMPESIRGALVDSIDTLDVVWAGMQAVFEERATPELAVMLLPHVLARADADKQRRIDEIRGRTEA